MRLYETVYTVIKCVHGSNCIALTLTELNHSFREWFYTVPTYECNLIPLPVYRPCISSQVATMSYGKVMTGRSGCLEDNIVPIDTSLHILQYEIIWNINLLFHQTSYWGVMIDNRQGGDNPEKLITADRGQGDNWLPGPTLTHTCTHTCTLGVDRYL